MKLLRHFMKVIARSENLLYLEAKIWLQKTLNLIIACCSRSFSGVKK